MAKGTLLASATSTKKGSVSSRAGTKNGKSNIIESAPTASKATAAATTKKGKAAAAPKKSLKKEQKPATSEESDNDDDDVQFVERDAAKDGPRHLDVKGKQYDKHYKEVVRDALEGMPLCMYECIHSSSVVTDVLPNLSTSNITEPRHSLDTVPSLYRKSQILHSSHLTGCPNDCRISRYIHYTCKHLKCNETAGYLKCTPTNRTKSKLF